MDCSTTNPLTWPSSVSRAHTIVMPPAAPLPIHFLAPFSTQPPAPSGRADVSRDTESEPCSGSVSANPPGSVPRATGSRYRSFCSGLAQCTRARSTSPPCTAAAAAIDPSAREISIATRPAANGDITACPGTSSPSVSRSSSPARATRSNGYSARSQCPSIRSSTSRP